MKPGKRLITAKTTSDKTGICKLCLQEAGLQMSHLVPRALYRHARSEGPGNNDPIVVTQNGTRRSSHQFRDRLLCWECEQRFCAGGEQYVMGQVNDRNQNFPLLNYLQTATPTTESSEYKHYSKEVSPEIDRMKLAYFAISVFWRASVHTWHSDSGVEIRINLGDKYNEAIRRYLLGQTPVPSLAALDVAVCSDQLNRQTFFPPIDNTKSREGRMVGFTARGISFFFGIGKSIPIFYRRLSLVNCRLAPIALYDCTKHPSWSF